MSSVVLLSISEQVYQSLKERILKGELLPGTRIIETKVSDEYSTSRLPVREALQKLSTDGLVEILPRRGSFVADIDFDKAAEILDITGALLGLAARRAALKATEAQIHEMKLHLLDVKETIRREEGKRYPHDNYDINADILLITDNSQANKILKEMKQKIDLIRVHSPSKRSMDITMKIWQEHWDIYLAIAERNQDKAALAAIKHLDEVKERLRSEFGKVTTRRNSDGGSSH